MFRSTLFWCPVILAGLFGYGVTEQRAKAVIVPTLCTQYTCKTVYAVWDTQYGTTVAISMQVVGQANNTNNAWADLFTPTTTEIRPYTANGNCDFWKWTSCTPMCGKSVIANSNPPVLGWQMPQEVAVAGTGQLYATYANQPRAVCTAAPGGNGVPSNPQANLNWEGYNPPGN